MDIEGWLSLAAATYMAAVVPGQNVAVVAAATGRGGMRAGANAVAGVLCAKLVWVVCALGLTLSVRDMSEASGPALQVASGCFLVWYGSKTVRAVRFDCGDCHTAWGRRRDLYLADGFWVGLANPVTLVFFVALFPAFLPAGVQPTTVSVACPVAGVVVGATAVALIPYVVAGNVMRRAGFGAWIGYASGGAVVALGGVILSRSVI